MKGASAQNGMKGGNGGAAKGGGGGKGMPVAVGQQKMVAAAAAAPQAKLQMVEAQFGESANYLYEGLLDLNTPTPNLQGAWSKVLDMRDSLLRLYGVPITPRTQGMAIGVTPPQQQQHQDSGESPQTVDWKSKLIALVAKRAKRSLTKGEVSYAVETGSGGFFASCSSELLGNAYTGDEAASKRLAEHAAARMAIMTEFPEEQLAEEAQAWYGGAQQQQQWGQQPAPGGGKKRSHQEAAGDNLEGFSDAKSRLIHGMQLLLGRPVLKGDVVYDTQPVEADSQNPSMFCSTVTLPTYDSQMIYKGEALEGKKQAEMSAAAQVLAALHETVGAAEEEHKAKKARMRKDKMAAMKQKATGGQADGADSNVDGQVSEATSMVEALVAQS